ncbi:MAG: hypothetical protein HY066_05130 [Betaproteobacteria bacterium]|nr:hypothetical protein [Betaproteobacteria bacterium]
MAKADHLRSDKRPPSVLETKLFPPRHSRHVIARLCFDRFPEELARHRVIVIRAPAGFGKTVMAVQFAARLEASGVKLGWVSLDAHDNDPSRLLHLLVAAAAKFAPGITEAVSGPMAAGALLPPVAVLTPLLNAIGAATGDMLLVLDDLHELVAPAAFGCIDFILSNLPDNLACVITSRSDLPFPVSRLQAEGMVGRLGPEDLQFSIEETREFLTQRHALSLSAADLAALHRRTEGWAAALQLAALSLSRQVDPSAFIATLSAPSAGMVDYLCENVLNALPVRPADFLLRASAFARMGGKFCDAALEIDDSGAILQSLEHANMLIQPVGDDGQWYRLHGLLADFLEARLRRERPAELPMLFARAAAWCETHELLDEAVDYYLAALDFAAVERILARVGWRHLAHGEFHRLRQWLEKLPDAILRTRPTLCMLHAWCLIYPAEFAKAELRILETEQELKRRQVGKPIDDATIALQRAELQVVRAMLHQLRDDAPDIDSYSLRLREAIPEDNPFMLGMIELTTAFYFRARGEYEKTLRPLELAIEYAEAGGGMLLNTLARISIGVAWFQLGHSIKATEIFQVLLHDMHLGGWEGHVLAGMAQVRFAQVLYERNELAEAAAHVAQAIRVSEAQSGGAVHGMALVERARIALARGDRDAAASDVRAAKQIGRSHGVRRVQAAAIAMQVTMALRDHSLGRAEALLEDLAALQSAPLRHLSEAINRLQLLRASLALARHQYSQCLRFAGEVLQNSRETGCAGRVVEALVLQACAWAGLKAELKARQKFEAAADRAAAAGFARSILDITLTHALPTGVMPKRADEPVAPRPAPSTPDAGLDIQLSDREIQLMRLLAAGHRNREIGAMMAITEQTVKWHLKNIYAKIDVNTRTKAIARLRATGLIAG